MTPTARSLAKLRKDGWLADKVERREGPATHDLFGIGDIFALRGRRYGGELLDLPAEVLLVQATSATNVAARVRKIADNPNIGTIREAGIRIEVWGWKAPTKKRRTWDVRIVDCS